MAAAYAIGIPNGVDYLFEPLVYEQYKKCDTSAETVLLKKYLTKINERYRELHEVGDYANLLNISAGHLSDVVKTQRRQASH